MPRTKKKTTNKPTSQPLPKDGRERVRRSFVVYCDTAEKFAYIAKHSGVLASELLDEVMAQTVTAWERVHGPIGTQTAAPAAVDILAAIKGADNREKLPLGNPAKRHKPDTADE